MSAVLSTPIIILGNTRSGTTIVQNVLAEHPDLVSWYEPRNMWQYADPRRAHDEFTADDATDRVKRYVRRRFLLYQQRHGGRRIVEKTPVNILRIPYVDAIFPDAPLLYVVRDPLSFISSVERKWQRSVTTRGVFRRLPDTPVSQLHHYGAQYLRQKYEKRVLRRQYLSVWGPRYRGIHADLQTEDQLTVVARQWAVCSRKAEEALGNLTPGRVLRLRYEDFVRAPVQTLERVCRHCGVDMTDDMIRAAETRVADDRLEKWRRFDPHDLARLLPELAGEMARHGYTVPPEIASAAATRSGAMDVELSARGA